MARRLPPLKALPAFEATARLLSFSAAAQELHLTHGAISRQIQTLESRLGTTLFRRLNRRIELTASGTTLLPAVRSALDILEAGVAQVSVRPRQGPLVISCLPTFMMRWLIPRLYDFNARHPDIEVHLSASYDAVNFERDGVDAAIRFGSGTRAEGIEAHAFLEEQVGPVLSPALLERRPLKRLADLRRHTLLHTESRPDAWAQWSRHSAVDGLEVAAGPRFEHFYFMLEAAVGGLGVALAPHPLVAEDLRLGRLVAPFGFVASGRAYCLLHPKRLANASKVGAFRSWIAEIPSQSAIELPKPPRRARRRRLE